MEQFKLIETIGDYDFLGNWRVGLVTALIMAFCISTVLLVRNAKRIEKAYFVIIILFGSIFSFVFPPLSAPDEVLHYAAAYEMSNHVFGINDRDADGHLIIRAQDTFLDDYPRDDDPCNATVLGMHLTRTVYRELHDRGLLSTGEEGYKFTLQEPVNTIKLAYLPQTIGFVIARALNLGGFGLVYLGRFMNLLMFAILGTLSIRRMPIGRYVIIGVSLFPMTLELASSLSYDVYIISLSFYLTACVLELALTDRQVKWTDIARFGVLALLLSPCKMVYAPMFLLCLMIPRKRWKSMGTYAGSVLIIGVLIVLSILLVNMSTFFQYVDTSQTVVNQAEWAGTGAAAETYSLIGTLKTPIILLKIWRNTFSIKGIEYLQTMVGSWLGNMDKGLAISPFIIAVYWYIAIRLGTFVKHYEPKLSTWQRIVMLLTAAAVICLIITSMLSAYTPKGTDYALGVQGRYFLPVLPMVLLTFRFQRGRKQKEGYDDVAVINRTTRLLISVEMLLDMYVLYSMFNIIAARTGV